MSMTAATPAARYIGQSVTRKEDQRLLTGHGQYVDDITVPGMLHAAFLRSDIARGAITGIDLEAARALAGVVAVFTFIESNNQGALGTTAEPERRRVFHSVSIVTQQKILCFTNQ